LKALFASCAVAAAAALLLVACGSHAPAEETPRAVRTVEVRYGGARDTNRYFGSVRARYEIEQAFRVGGKVMERRVDVGQTVREGDVLAVLDDEDYRLTEQATRQQLEAATARARQAESDARRLEALKVDGSVSASEEEHAQSELRTSRAAAEAETRKLALARNQVQYTVLRASSDGVVTSVRLEVGQVVAAGEPVISISNEDEPEIVVDVPEAHLAAFKDARFTASLASAPDDHFEVELRELSAQAAAQTRTYRARLKPVTPRTLPLGATATLVAERVASGSDVAVIPASAITQHQGKPALWAVRRTGKERTGTVELIPVKVHGYRTDEILVSGPAPGVLVVTAGVQKMAPGMRVALPPAAQPSVIQ
jgi:membrane fusion protein, multidrug efflux system